MRIKTAFASALVLALAILVSACGMSRTDTVNEDTKESVQVELNQRQKDILKENGLPTDYDELEDHQKSAIQVIETGLEYMEEKYGGVFRYVGYVPSGILDEEQLTCYEEGTPKEKIITVKISYKDRVRAFTDNYAEINAADQYTNELTDYFRQAATVQCLVITEINGLKDGYSEESVLNDSNAFVRIIFSDGSLQDGQLKDIAEGFGKWMRDNNPDGYGEFRFYLFSREAFSQLNIYNFDSVIEEYGTLKVTTLNISNDGRTEIN